MIPDELDAMSEEFSRRFGLRPALSLDENFRYHHFARRAGAGGSLARALWVTARTPALPAAMKVRELARIALGR